MELFCVNCERENRRRKAIFVCYNESYCGECFREKWIPSIVGITSKYQNPQLRQENANRSNELEVFCVSCGEEATFVEYGESVCQRCSAERHQRIDNFLRSLPPPKEYYPGKLTAEPSTIIFDSLNPRKISRD